MILKSSTVHINSSSGDKTGAPAVNARSESPPATVDKSLLHHKLSIPLQSKLPKIELPKFAGDVTKFRSFWESFTNSVDLNPNLSTIDKFNYLKALLEGSPARAIQGLALTKNNYAAAIDILQKQSSKTQQIICGHKEDLLKIPPYSSDRTAHLRLVYDKVHANIRGLEALGIKTDQYGSFLIPVVIPPDVHLQIARLTTKDIWQIDEFLQVLRTEVEAREVSEGVKVHDTTHFHHTSHNHKSDKRTAAAMLIQDNGPNPSCVYCRESHYSAFCTKITAIPSRREILRRF